MRINRKMESSQSSNQPRAGAYAQMFRITCEDTTFNDWEQALTALLQYEFKCPVQAEWQLFGREREGVLERPTFTGDGTDQEREVLQKIASVQKASLGVYERAKLTARQEDTFEDPEVQQSEWVCNARVSADGVFDVSEHAYAR